MATRERLSDRGQTLYNWEHYIPLVQRKPGALRNRAPVADMPEPLQQMSRAYLRDPGGDRVMAQMLAILPAAGLDPVLASAELALDGTPRRCSWPPSRWSTPARYDSLRINATEEADHASAGRRTQATSHARHRGAWSDLVEQSGGGGAALESSRWMLEWVKLTLNCAYSAMTGKRADASRTAGRNRRNLRGNASRRARVCRGRAS